MNERMESGMGDDAKHPQPLDQQMEEAIAEARRLLEKAGADLAKAAQADERLKQMKPEIKEHFPGLAEDQEAEAA